VSLIFLALAGYLLGAIPSGAIAARIKGRDILAEGSGNPGATNALRVLGPLWAIAVLLCDAGKGLLAAYLGFRLGGPAGSALAGASAALGHAYSIFLRGRGGKVVAVSLGVLLLWDWHAIAAALAVFLVTLALTRVVSLGSILGALCAAVDSTFTPLAPVLRVGIYFLVLLLIWRHRPNIASLWHGEERRLGGRG